VTLNIGHRKGLVYSHVTFVWPKIVGRKMRVTNYNLRPFLGIGRGLLRPTQKVADSVTYLFGRWLSRQDTSDPTWQGWRGKSVTKRKGRRSNSARSSSAIYMGLAHFFVNLGRLHGPRPTIRPSYFLARVVFGVRIFFLVHLGRIHGPSPTIRPFYFWPVAFL